MGIEPTSEAWEASILPLYDARSIRYSRIIPKNVSSRTAATRRFLERCSLDEHMFLKETREALARRSANAPGRLARASNKCSLPFCVTICRWVFCGGFHAGWALRTI